MHLQIMSRSKKGGTYLVTSLQMTLLVKELMFGILVTYKLNCTYNTSSLRNEYDGIKDIRLTRTDCDKAGDTMLCGGHRGQVGKVTEFQHSIIRSSHRCDWCRFEPRTGHM